MNRIGLQGDTIKKLELLSPSTFLPLIESRIAELEEVLKIKQFAVKKNPSGLVRIVRQKNYLQFYKRSSPTDAQGTYIPRSQEKLARALIQNDYDTIHVQIVKDTVNSSKTTDEIEKELTQQFNEVMKHPMNFEFEWMNCIPPDPNGKLRMIVCNIKVAAK